MLHARGYLLFDQVLKSTKSFAWVKIPKDNFLDGVIVCTLFDNEELPVAERLFFVAPKQGETQISIEADTTVFEPRQTAQLKISAPRNNKLLAVSETSKISLSIIPKQANSQMTGDDIRTWLLLNSDLDVPVPYAPGLLFDKEVGSQDQLIDEFLLTRGWRRFRWEVITNNEKFAVSYTHLTLPTILLV